MAAFAADAALDEPRASITAAPLCCTVGMNSLAYQFVSTRLMTLLPATDAASSEP